MIDLGKSDKILIDSELVTSKIGFDYGSTFNVLACGKCNEIIGRCYRTTTPELDPLRGRFSFDLSKIQLYELRPFYIFYLLCLATKLVG